MRLKELLSINNVRQKDVCAALGIYSSTMSQYVTGQREPDINTLIKLADYFGVSVDYLVEHDTAAGFVPPARNYIYAGNKKYDLSVTPVKLEINGVSFDISVKKDV